MVTVDIEVDDRRGEEQLAEDLVRAMLQALTSKGRIGVLENFHMIPEGGSVFSAWGTKPAARFGRDRFGEVS
jgi:hypothetical protein